MSMNNNIFAHVYSNAELSTVHAYDFYHTWKRLATSIRKTAAGIAEITMKNNDVHVFLSDILYPSWCCGKTYYMDGILYRGGYPFYSNRSEEKNMGLFDREIEIDKAGKEGYEAAMDEAREAMIELSHLTRSELYSIFGVKCVLDVIRENSIQNVIRELCEFKEKNSIHVGDEYSFNCNTRVVVTDIRKFENRVYFLLENGDADLMNIDEFKQKFKKTGKIYPELTSILKGLKS